MVSPLQVLISRKLEARFTSLHDTFLRMDVDGDGFISITDMQKGLYQILGMEVTNAQVNALFDQYPHTTRETNENDDNDGPQKNRKVIRYEEFVRHLYHTANDYTHSSSSDFSVTSAFDLKGDSEDMNDDMVDLVGNVAKLDAIRAPFGSVPKEILSALRRKMITRSSNKSGTRETRLFLEMDDDRSGKISPEEFQLWATKMGLILTDEQCKSILGKHYHPDDGIDLPEFMQFMDSLENADSLGDSSPLAWESPNSDEMKKRRLTAKAVAECTTLALNEAFSKCVDDDKSDHDIIEAFTSQLHAKQISLIKEFENADKDNNGKLDASELQLAFFKSDLFLSLKRTKKLIEKFDRHGDGKLNKSDFVFCISNNGSFHKDNNEVNVTTTQTNIDDEKVIKKFRRAMDNEIVSMREFFDKLDLDRSKTLSMNQLKLGFDKLNVEVSHEELSRIMKKVNVDRTGSIKFHQFVKLFSISASDSLL